TLAASFTKDMLEKIPNARDPWVIVEQTPGMIMSGVNVGGNLSGQQTSFSAMGSSSNQQWNINGAVISDIASGNSSPTYYDFDSFEEIQITTGGADASQQGARVGVLGFYDTSSSGCATLAGTNNPSSAANADGSFRFSLQDFRDCAFGDLTTLTNHNARLQFQEATGHQTEFSYTYGDKYRG